MTKLHLTRGDNYEGVYLRLPATPAEVGEAFAWLDEISRYAGDTKIVDVECTIRNIGQYIDCANVNNDDDVSKLNQLALKIDAMSERERQTFSGALDVESINGLDDILRVADRLDQYIFIHDVTNDRDLGVFLVDCGYMDFPERVRPYLDYAGIGAEYYAKCGGAYTDAGYILKKDAAQKQSETNGAVFRLFLRTAKGKSLRLSLPATEEELDHAMQYLNVHDFAQCSIDRTDCIPYLDELVPSQYVSVADANELALSINEMRQQDGMLMKYLSVLAVERPETFTQAYHLALELDDYERVPTDTEEYGHMVLRRIGADQELLDTIDGYMDFEKLGEDAMAEDGVRQTEFGLIRRCSHPFDSPDAGGMRME